MGALRFFLSGPDARSGCLSEPSFKLLLVELGRSRNQNRATLLTPNLMGPADSEPNMGDSVGLVSPCTSSRRPNCCLPRAGADSFGPAQQNRPLTQNAPKPNNAWWRSAGTGNCNPRVWIGMGRLGKGSGNSRVSMSLPAMGLPPVAIALLSLAD